MYVYSNVMCIIDYTSSVLILTYILVHEASHEEHTYMYVCVHVHVVCMYYHGTIHTYILHTYITYILMCVWTDPIVHIQCSISVYTPVPS